MARARLLKPAFFKNERLARLSAHHRLCFQGLWTLADREGRLEDRPERIKAELFPYEPEITVEIVDAMLAMLANAGFMVRYGCRINGNGWRRYIGLPTFLDHQTPHHREPPSRIPAAPSRLLKPRVKLGSDVGADQGEPQAAPQSGPPDPVTGDPVTGEGAQGALKARAGAHDLGRSKERGSRVAPDGRAKRAASAPLTDAQEQLLDKYGFGR